MSTKISLSVALVAYNEEENIARTLSAISGFAEEIVVVDSFSVDKTVEIAKDFGAKVFQEEWKGFVEQKNSALKKCTHNWILFLDCDEVVTVSLAEEIVSAVYENIKYAYLLDRRTVYLGKELRYSWRPDWKLRLVRKDCNPRWVGNYLHEGLIADCPQKKLKGKLLHYPFKNLEHHYEKTLFYSKTSAKVYFQSGRKFSFFKLFFSPIFAFVKLYFINLGFLDGVRGLFAGVSAFVSSFLKYSFLWEKNYERKLNEKNKRSY
ncbi:MAG: glycosyltransferase family 2 protein [Ignavibacteria bacterium]|nr:glycosyltransferase family 2 protein [Ignavibacteria bacterium]